MIAYPAYKSLSQGTVIRTKIMRSADSQILLPGVHSGPPVLPQQLNLNSSLPENVVFLAAPQNLAVFSFDVVVELHEVA